MFKGKYHRQLTILIRGTAVVMVFIILFFIGYRSVTTIKNEYRDSVRQNVATCNQFSDVTLSSISAAVSIFAAESGHPVLG